MWEVSAPTIAPNPKLGTGENECSSLLRLRCASQQNLIRHIHRQTKGLSDVVKITTPISLMGKFTAMKLYEILRDELGELQRDLLKNKNLGLIGNPSH